MSNYLQIINSSLEEKLRAFEKAIDIEVSKLSEEEKEEFYEYYLDDYQELRYDIPKQLYSSFVLSWHSFVEHQLIQICKKINLTVTINIEEQKDLGKGIRRARKFLIEGLSYTIDDAHWQELINISKVRNKIAHGSIRFPFILNQNTIALNNNTFSISRDGETHYVEIERSLYDYLDKNDIFDLQGIPSISITFNYCEYLVAFGKTLFSKIHQDLQLT